MKRRNEMKKQIKSNWQTIVFATIAAIIFIFAANSPASAQTTYKVGDRVEHLSAGKWVPAEILKVEDDGYYVIRDEETGISGIWKQAKSIRSIKAKAQTNNQNNADNQGQNQRDENNRADNQTAERKSAQTAKTNRFGARDPRKCDDTKDPARGAITAALALKYLNCQMEYVSGGHLYLAENIKVEVGGGVPYTPNLGAFEAINVRVPLYPIRGSYLRYQCDDLKTEHVGPPDTNCTTYNQPKATGYCYKTTFGDWRCSMSDRSSHEKENVRKNVAPPKP
jgi:hypothetical protein